MQKKQWTILNNVEQKIILNRMLETTNAENIEQFLWEKRKNFKVKSTF